VGERERRRNSWEREEGEKTAKIEEWVVSKKEDPCERKGEKKGKREEGVVACATKRKKLQHQDSVSTDEYVKSGCLNISGKKKFST
jgi:hypothetical protein